MIKAVCFDMFHTLADPGRYPETEESAILGVTHEEWSAALWEDSFCRDRGLGLVASVEEIFDRACAALPKRVTEEQKRQAARCREERFRRMLTDIDPLILDTVRALSAGGFKIGLISNADVCDRLHWAESPLYPYFDDTIFSCDVGLVKPDPAIYLLSLERLGVRPGEALFVGDGGSSEMKGARAAGLRAVCTEYLIRYPSPERERIRADAEFTVESFAEIRRLAESL